MSDLAPLTPPGFRGRGLGGGSQAAQQPVVVDDNLRSQDRMEVIIGMGEGPIKGFSNGLQSFYLGSTQYQNPDGSFNFDLFQVDLYVGNNPAEQIVPVLGGHQAFRGLYQNLAFETIVAFNSQATDITSVILRLHFTAFYKTGTDAQLASIPGVANTTSTFLPNTMSLEVQVQALGDPGFTNPFGGFISIEGKTQTDEYHQIPVILTGSGPFYFKVINHTPDIPSARCTVQLEGIYEVSGGIFGLTRSNDVNVQLADGVPVVRTSGAPSLRNDGTYGIDYLNVRMLVSSLYYQDTHGNVYTDTVNFRIEFKETVSLTWINPFPGDCAITGKTTSQPYVAEWRWKVTPVDTTYDIRITVLTAVETNHFYTIGWESFQEIVGGPAQFNNTAVIHAVGQATDQFSSIPTFSAELDWKICKIPSNYNPYTRVYTGVWDGTFVEDWTSNPAWCLYDLAMNATYGARASLPYFNIDQYDTYALGQWCDELVWDGQGGLEPRYTFNGIISDPRGIRDQLRYMAGVCNATFLDDLNGSIRVVYDHDEPAAAIFTPENITIEGFIYSYTDMKTRYNSLTVQYSEPALLYQTVPLLVQDTDNIATYGLIPLNFPAIGCTNKQEAIRRAAYKLITCTTEKEIVSFVTNRKGLMIRPFNVILVGDPDMGNSVTGRIKTISDDRTIIYLRDLIYLELGLTYTFNVNAPNSAYPTTSDNPLVVVSIPFYSQLNGATYALVLSSPLPANVDDRAEFALGCTGDLTGVPKVYRVTAIEEVDGDPDNITITAIEVNRNKWTLSDNAQMGATLTYVNFPADIAPPSGFQITTQLITVNDAVLADVVATWQASPDPRVNNYQVQYRQSGETAWVPIAQTNRLIADIYNVAQGTYDFRVAAFVGTSTQSSWVYANSQTAGIDVPPDDVQQLALSVVGSHFSLTWAPVAALNLSYYWIRFSPITDGTASWAGATDVVTNIQATAAQVPASTGTYFVKAVNTAGIESVNAAYVIGIANAVGLTTVETLEQDPAWTGTKTNFTVASGILDATDPTVLTSTYEFQTSDYGGVFACNLSLGMVVTADLIGDTMSTWATLAGVTSLSGVPTSAYNTTVQISVYNGTTWGPFVPFGVGIWTGQSFKFLVTVTSTMPSIQVQLFRISLVVQMQSRIENGSNIESETGGSTITFSTPFKIAPTMTITNKSAVQGDYYVLGTVSDTSFFITWYDTTGTAVVRLFDWIAVGFGGT